MIAEKGITGNESGAGVVVSDDFRYNQKLDKSYVLQVKKWKRTNAT